MTINDALKLWAEREGHLVANQDPGPPLYVGFLHPTGLWYIAKESTSGAITTVRFIRGTSDYATNWTGRAALTYATADEVFV